MRIQKGSAGTKGGAGTSNRRASATRVTSREPRATGASAATGPFRVVLADRRAASRADIAGRLEQSGHAVVAHVASMRGALEAVEYFTPDALLVAPYLEDGLGVAAALACARDHPAVAAVVLMSHAGGTNPGARPDWGPISIAPTDATADALDGILRGAVTQAREAPARPAASHAKA